MKPLNSARLAGISLVLMAIVAGFAFGYAHNTLIVADSPISTLENLTEASGLFVLEILAWIVILFLDVVVSIALYKYFEPALKRLSMAMAGLRLLYSLVLGVAIFKLVSAGCMIHTAVASDDVENAKAVMAQIHAFEHIWSAGLIVFGLHLLGLGVLAIQSSRGSKFWGVLLMIAGFGYTFLHSAILLDGHEAMPLDLIETILIAPMTIGELGFAIWLLIIGSKKK